VTGGDGRTTPAASGVAPWRSAASGEQTEQLITQVYERARRRHRPQTVTGSSTTATTLPDGTTSTTATTSPTGATDGTGNSPTTSTPAAGSPEPTGAGEGGEATGDLSSGQDDAPLLAADDDATATDEGTRRTTGALALGGLGTALVLGGLLGLRERTLTRRPG
jgi:hypothetical protein